MNQRKIGACRHRNVATASRMTIADFGLPSAIQRAAIAIHPRSAIPQSAIRLPASLAAHSPQQRKLPGKIVLVDAQRAFEEAAQMGEHARLAVPCRELDEPHQVEHQRRRQQRIAPLPGELHDHRRAQEAAEVNVVPGRLPVAQAADVFDRDERLRLVAEDLAAAGGPCP